MRRTSCYYLAIILATVTLLSSCRKDDTTNERSEIKSDSEKLITLKSGVTVLLKSGNYYLSDDILLSETQLKSLEKEEHIYSGITGSLKPETTTHPSTGMPLYFKLGTKAVGQYPTPYNMWAMVRYVYGSSLSPVQREIMRLAIAHWEAN